MEERIQKKVLVTQSNYIPWKGYFSAISKVDVFVIIPKFPEDEYNKDKKFFLNSGFSILEDNKYGLYLFR
tara:strand:+ start:2144 stop:2353 length:210 start_codon:yes stop_codon:yes gene_type:complete